MRSVLADRAMMLFGRGKRGGRGGQEEGVNSLGDGGGQDEWRRSCSVAAAAHMNQFSSEDASQGVEATINLIGILSLGDGQKTPAKSSRGRRGRQGREDGYRRREDPMKTRMMECLGFTSHQRCVGTPHKSNNELSVLNSTS